MLMGLCKALIQKGFYKVFTNFIHTHISFFSYRYGWCFIKLIGALYTQTYTHAYILAMFAYRYQRYALQDLIGALQSSYTEGVSYTYRHYGLVSYRYQGCFVKSLYLECLRGFVKLLYRGGLQSSKRLCAHIHTHICTFQLFTTDMRVLCKAPKSFKGMCKASRNI